MRNCIEEYEFEELEIRDIMKKISDRRQSEDGILSKRRGVWFGIQRFKEKKKGNIEWDSCRRDRIQKKYLAGVTEYRRKNGKEKCMCVRSEGETEVEHILRHCCRRTDGGKSGKLRMRRIWWKLSQTELRL